MIRAGIEGVAGSSILIFGFGVHFISVDGQRVFCEDSLHRVAGLAVLRSVFLHYPQPWFGSVLSVPSWLEIARSIAFTILLLGLCEDEVSALTATRFSFASWCVVCGWLQGHWWMLHLFSFFFPGLESDFEGPILCLRPRGSCGRRIRGIIIVNDKIHSFYWMLWRHYLL